MVSDAEREAVLVDIAVLAEELNRQVQNLRRFVSMLQAMDNAAMENGASADG